MPHRAYPGSIAAGCFLLFVLPLARPSAAVQLQARGARAGGLPSIAATTDVSSSNSPAAPGPARPSISLWAAQLYGIPELRWFGVRIESGGKAHSGAFQATAFRFDRYSEWSASLLFSLALDAAEKLRVGVASTGTRRSASRSGGDLSLRASGGIFLDISRRIAIATSIDSPLSIRRKRQAGRTHDARESVLAGLCFRTSQSLHLYADLFLQHPFPPSWRLGFASRLSGAFNLRGGISTAPRRIVIGFSVQTAAVAVHFAFDYHMLLGLSNAVEFGFML